MQRTDSYHVGKNACFSERPATAGYPIDSSAQPMTISVFAIVRQSQLVHTQPVGGDIFCIGAVTIRLDASLVRCKEASTSVACSSCKTHAKSATLPRDTDCAENFVWYRHRSKGSERLGAEYVPVDTIKDST